MPTTGAVATQAIKLIADVSSFQRSMSAASALSRRFKHDVSSMSRTASSAFSSLSQAVYGFVMYKAVDQIKSAGDQIVELQKRARQFQVDPTSLLRLGYAAELAEQDVDNLYMMLGQMNRRLTDPASSADVTKGLREIGLTIADVTDAPGLGKFFVLADAMKKQTNEMLRQDAAIRLFGRSGQSSVGFPAQGAAQILQDMGDSLAYFGDISENQLRRGKQINDMFTSLKYSATGLKFSFLEAFGPAISQALDNIALAMKKGADNLSDFATSALSTAEFVDRAFVSLKALFDFVHGSDSWLGVKSPMWKGISAGIVSGFNYAQKALKAVGVPIHQTWIDQLDEDAKALWKGAVKGANDVLDKQDEVTKKFDDIREKAKQAGKEIRDVLGGGDDGDNTGIDTVNYLAKIQKLGEELTKNLQPPKEALSELLRMIPDMVGQGDLSPSLVGPAQIKGVKDYTQALENMLSKTAEIPERLSLFQRGLEGLNEAMAQGLSPQAYARGYRDLFNLFESFDEVTKTVGDDVDNFSAKMAELNLFLEKGVISGGQYEATLKRYSESLIGEDLETPLERYSKKMEDLNFLFDRGIVSADQYGSIQNKWWTELQRSIGNTSKEMKDLLELMRPQDLEAKVHGSLTGRMAGAFPKQPLSPTLNPDWTSGTGIRQTPITPLQVNPLQYAQRGPVEVRMDSPTVTLLGAIEQNTAMMAGDLNALPGGDLSNVSEPMLPPDLGGAEMPTWGHSWDTGARSQFAAREALAYWEEQARKPVINEGDMSTWFPETGDHMSNWFQGEKSSRRLGGIVNGEFVPYTGGKTRPGSYGGKRGFSGYHHDYIQGGIVNGQEVRWGGHQALPSSYQGRGLAPEEDMDWGFLPSAIRQSRLAAAAKIHPPEPDLKGLIERYGFSPIPWFSDTAGASTQYSQGGVSRGAQPDSIGNAFLTMVNLLTTIAQNTDLRNGLQPGAAV